MSEGNAQWCSIAAKGDDVNDHDYIRKHILEYKGVPDKEPTKVDYDFKKKTIRAAMEDFFSLCRNRILMGRFRYGEFDGRYIDCVEDMKRCLKKYEQTRNSEFLVDMANYNWIEFRHGSHPNKHFASIDDGEHSKQ